MHVTAREVNEQQFSDAWRGYSQEEVDDFLDRVAESLEALHEDNEGLRRRNVELEQALATTREAEEMLKKTLVTAQRAAEEAIAKAKAKAEQLVSEAERRARGANEEARKIIGAAEEEASRKALQAERDAEAKRKALDNSIARLSSYRSDLQKKVQRFIADQQRALDELTTDGDVPEATSDATEAPTETEGSVVTPMSQAARPGGNRPESSSGRVVRVDRSSDDPVESEAQASPKRSVRSLFFREEG